MEIFHLIRFKPERMCHNSLVERHTMFGIVFACLCITMEIKIYTTIILALMLYDCEMVSHIKEGMQVKGI